MSGTNPQAAKWDRAAVLRSLVYGERLSRYTLGMLKLRNDAVVGEALKAQAVIGATCAKHGDSILVTALEDAELEAVGDSVPRSFDWIGEGTRSVKLLVAAFLVWCIYAMGLIRLMDWTSVHLRWWGIVVVPLAHFALFVVGLTIWALYERVRDRVRGKASAA